MKFDSVPNITIVFIIVCTKINTRSRHYRPTNGQIKNGLAIVSEINVKMRQISTRDKYH